MLKLFMNQGPWGPWSNSGSNSGGNSGNDKSKGEKSSPEEKSQQKKPQEFGNDFDEILKKSEDFVRKIFGGNNSSSGGNGGSGKNKKWDDFKKNLYGKSPKSLAGLAALGLVFLWLLFGFYKVDAKENAVILYFGKFYSISTPGLNYYIPYPFGQVIKRNIGAVYTEEFGFSSNSSKSDKRNFDAESLMLTGDENIVDIEFQLQWQIADIKNFVFNIVEPNQTIRKAMESAMREIIARTPIADALSDGKKRIEQETKDLLQQTLDLYGAGVRVSSVQLRRVDPPLQVIDAFRDVQTAKADKEKEINQAQSYANDIIPRARGMAAQMKEQSEAYAQEVVTNAQGEAGRFLSVYNQYSKAKQITKKRIYLETMEKIYRDMDKILIDKGAAKSGVMPYFPLNELQKK